MIKFIISLLLLSFSIGAHANPSPEGEDMYINGYTPTILFGLSPLNLFLSKPQYTLLDTAEYYATLNNAQFEIQLLLHKLQENHFATANDKVAFIAKQLIDIPYLSTGAMGEGDWQPTATTYQPYAVHIKQDPVYRLDGLDCVTVIQVAMGLLYSTNLNDFNETILKIAYGAAGNPNGEIVHYYNRNNFIDGDWNPINERNHWLMDATSAGALGNVAKTTSATLTRQNWFAYQQLNPANTVRALSDENGAAMAERLQTVYGQLHYPHFDSETVSMTYIPKETLALIQPDQSYLPNQALFDSIPTPAVVEIIRDVKKWNIGGKNIKDITGSESNVSHLGLLYRENFKQGDIIFQKTTCHYDDQHQKICEVAPVICQKSQCNELMFLNATVAYPDGYYWYQQSDGHYTCSSTKPAEGIDYTRCNRVETRPLFDYITNYQYGAYSFMSSPSILGIHIEKLSETTQ